MVLVSVCFCVGILMLSNSTFRTPPVVQQYSFLFGPLVWLFCPTSKIRMKFPVEDISPTLVTFCFCALISTSSQYFLHSKIHICPHLNFWNLHLHYNQGKNKTPVSRQKVKTWLQLLRFLHVQNWPRMEGIIHLITILLICIGSSPETKI